MTIFLVERTFSQGRGSHQPVCLGHSAFGAIQTCRGIFDSEDQSKFSEAAVETGIHFQVAALLKEFDQSVATS
jgi:hypothetical protein